MEKQIDLEKGTVTLKKGEDSTQYSLRDEKDLEKLVKQAQRGWYFDTDASKELGELRKVKEFVDGFNERLSRAATDDDALAALVRDIEREIGRPLTRQEKKDAERNPDTLEEILMDPEENSKLVQHLQRLEQKIESLEKDKAAIEKREQERTKEEQMRELQAAADKLEKQFDGSDGKPKFDRQEVFKFAAENGIGDLKLAFRAMTYDQWGEKVREKTLEELKKQDDKRKSAYVEGRPDGPGQADIHAPKTRRGRNYRDVGADALKTAREKGLGLFTE